MVDHTVAVIDCDVQPVVPDGWSVEEHRESGKFTWDRDEQEKFGWAWGRDLNANVLYYLLANPHLIPEYWEKVGKAGRLCIPFRGTTYRHPGGFLVHLSLGYADGSWFAAMVDGSGAET